MSNATRSSARESPSTKTGSDVANGSVWMIVSTAVVSVGSFIFWLVAARRGSSEVVGNASALFSATFFLSFVGSFGLPIAVSRYAADRSALHTQRFRYALLATVVAAALTTAIFVAIDPRTLLEPTQQWGSAVSWLVLWLVVAGVAVSVIVDVRLMGQRRWSAVFARSAAIAIVRLPPLLWIEDNPLWLFLIAAGGYAITALPFIPDLIRPDEPLPATIEPGVHREALRFSGINYLSQLALQAPFFASPLAVAIAVPGDENAAFYLSWGIMSVVYLLIHALGKTLLVEGVKEVGAVAEQARISLLLGFGVSIVACIASLPAGPVFEFLYGEEYDSVSSLLPLLVAGTVPFVVTRVSLAVARVNADTKTTLTVATWSAVTVIVGVAIGAGTGGTHAAAVGWLIGSFATLVVSAPALRHQLSGQPRKSTTGVSTP